MTTDERWEAIQLTQELTPDADLLPELNELLAEMPDHASALYERGTLLLRQGDEAGIGDLERLMQKDASSTLAACETAWRFYLERNAELAEQYRSRYLARSSYEDEVKKEFQTMPADATLAAHDLDDETADKIRQLVEAHGTHVRRAYLMRRILKTDHALHDYVLAFETTFFTLGNKGPSVVKRLAQQEFPVSAFVVHLGSQPYKRFRKHIKQLAIEPLVGK